MERDYQTEVDAHRDFINKMAKKLFCQSAVAEEAARAVIAGLAADDWAVLKKYRGEASMAGFVKALAVTGLEDFAAKKFACRRPPPWVRQLGAMWEKLYTALCCQGATIDEAAKFVRATMAGVGNTEAEAAARQLLRHIFNREVTAEEMPLAELPALAAPSSANQESERVLATVLRLVLGGERPGMGDFHDAFCAMRFSISSEERLFLKMCYQDGLPTAQAGRLLGMGRLQAAARMRRLLVRLRQELERGGLYQQMLLLWQAAGEEGIYEER